MRDATFWAEQLRANVLSFSELMDFIAHKIQKSNPELNALITFDKAQALAEFDATQDLSKPFAGQPIPLKILGQSKSGWPATAGAKLLTQATSSQTDNFVKKVTALGFTPAGQTNAPEFGFKNITDPALYGVTRNPWNLDYSPGGSSGGAAAAVAAGLFPIAGASDGGGSIRIPASFTGLIGLKPTRGTMPVGPIGWRSWQGASINFALTISMRDTARLFYGLRETAACAPYQAPQQEWQHQKASNKKRLKIAYTTASPVGTPVSEDAKEAVKQAIVFLEKAGHQLVEIPYPIDGIQLMESYYAMNGGETAAMFDHILVHRDAPLKMTEMELMTWGIYQYGRKLDASRYIRSLEIWDEAAFVMEQKMQDFDLFLTPTTAFSAPKITEDLQSDQIRQKLTEIDALSVDQAGKLIYEMFEKSLMLTPYTQLANLTGQPAISLPTYVNKKNLPLGIQFMAAKGREDLLFQVGQLFEEQQQLKRPFEVNQGGF